MELLYYIIIIVIGYLFGCIQSAYIIGKLKKIDIREHGSKNSGASNAFSIMGWKTGVVVGLIDIFKAAIPVFILTLIFPDNTLIQVVGGASVVLGHIFPVFIGFRGGKGTASIIGMTLGLHPMLFVVAVLAMLAGTFITDYIVIGTVATLIAVLIWMIVFNFNIYAIIIFVFIMGVNMYKHIVNFQRIANHTEAKVSEALFKSKDE